MDKSLARIQQRGMEAGTGLHGNLAGCNKLVHRRMGLRVIFREARGKVEVIQIVVIGKREDSQVYQTAEKRINLE